MATNTLRPWNPDEGSLLTILPIREHVASAALTVKHLLTAVPDPLLSQNPRWTRMDPSMQEYADLRTEIQRMVTGAKATNANKYARYILRGTAGQIPWITPAITLYHREPLEEVAFGSATEHHLLLPPGDTFVCIDGETQRIAWQLASLENPELMKNRVPVIIYHGMPLEHAKQGFYDLNTLEVKPNAAVAINMDTQDPATRIARSVMRQSDLLRDRVDLVKRQLGPKDGALVTISGLRTGIVTTLFGSAGFSYGSRPIELPEDVDEDAVEAMVVNTWLKAVDALQEPLELRAETVVAAPSVLGAIGAMLHKTLLAGSEGGELRSLDEVLASLQDVEWSRAVSEQDGRTRYPWDGIAGKVTKRGAFSIGGPKEVGHAILRALENQEDPSYRAIRARSEVDTPAPRVNSIPFPVRR